ncbi:hypothetical protein [Delftia acidovorans]|uniref:hypothetical protein n=1 Tax=Delftia acidovorans TaxID=80866 RepID=UPI003D0C5EA8
MSSILDFIDDKKKELASQELELVIDVFRNEFDNLTKLVNLFQRNKGKKGFEKGAYQTISEILFKDGVCKKDGSMLTKSQVSRYMGIVRAERVGESKSKSKPVAVVVAPVVQAVAVPGAVPDATKPVVSPAPVGGSDAIPEKITGYDPMKKLQEWEKSKSFVDQWDDDDEILYGQLRRWVFRFGKDVSGQNIVGICRKQFPNQTGFSKFFADTVELLFKQREKRTGHAHWTM